MLQIIPKISCWKWQGRIFFFASLGQLIFFHKHSINFFFREKAYHPAPLNYTYWSLIISPSPLGNMACVYILLIIYLSIESLASSIWLAVDATIYTKYVLTNGTASIYMQMILVILCQSLSHLPHHWLPSWEISLKGDKSCLLTLSLFTNTTGRRHCSLVKWHKFVVTQKWE